MPVKGMLIQACYNLKADTHGWIHTVENGFVTFETKNKLYKIPKENIIEVPIPIPSLDALMVKEPCFKLPLKTAFDLIFHEDNKWYEIYKCKKHGKLFLKDSRGTSVIYSRLILVEENYFNDFDEIFKKYHHISNDMLNYLKIAY